GQDRVDFVLGPYSSALTKAIAPVTEKYKMPMVEGNGADRSLFQQGYKYMFAVLNTSDYYLRAAVNILAEETKAARRDDDLRPRERRGARHPADRRAEGLRADARAHALRLGADHAEVRQGIGLRVLRLAMGRQHDV